MSHSYPSDQPGAIRPYSAQSARRRQAPHHLYDVFCGVLYLLKRCQWRMLPGLPQLAHLLQVFPAMERAAWPRSGSPKKNRLARPGKAMDGKSTSFCIVQTDCR